MTAKKIHFKEEAREKIRKGISVLANAVKTTLGPKGRNVIIEKSYGAPHITKDGVTVAKEIELEDKDENLGAQMVKEVASKTADKAGDGTTTATVLAESIYLEGLRNVTAGANPTMIKKGMDQAVKVAVDELSRMSKPIQSENEIEQVACISANNDAEIGKLIAKAIQSVGKDGRITVEDAKGFETDVHVVKGMNFDRGYLSPYFITEPKSQECLFDNAYVLIHEGKISMVKDLIPLLQVASQEGKPFLIIAEDIEGEAYSTLLLNRIRLELKVCAVKAPGFGDRRKAMLQDIAILTGGQVISEEIGLSLQNTTVDMLGKVKKAIISKDETTLVEGAGTKEEIEQRATQIRAQIQESDSDYDREKLEERLSKLTGGVAVVRVGAATEIEAKEKKDRIEDAQHATRAAVEEGVLPGGGTAYIRCIPALKKLAEKATGDEKTGIEIIIRALSSPLRQIAINAGFEGALIQQKVESLPESQGFNALTGEYVDMLEAGILDPKKVTRLALQNAASIASLLLTTEATVTEIKEDKPAMPAGAPGMGMDY